MAADRENKNVSKYYDRGNEIILKQIQYINEKSRHYGKECSICGEIAANMEMTEKLLKTGLRVFSVSPALIPLLSDTIGKAIINHMPKTRGGQSSENKPGSKE
jgi:phosphoenolpyruvate-protein kinase (PTS system EI component)